MEIKDILPILGVAIGWFLSEVAGAVKSKNLRRRSLRKAITSLYKLNFEMLEVKSVQEYTKNLSSEIKDWERGRQRAFSQYADNSKEFEKELDDAVMLVSEEYPLIAVKLSQFIRKYRFIKTKNLNGFTDKESIYMQLLSGNETGQLAAQYVVENSLLKVAFRVDFWLWCTLKLDIRKFKKGIKSGDMIHSSQAFKKQSNKKAKVETSE
ncbi:hypothetical protein [Vibrio diazotrophicus]|uniref:hypothetical protein n=1 Tax=Vibrio diazotrophicus TaxID=685 RepID=UPI0005A62963|nr:hypothetical protein [Vibrio diazotrophicus]